MSKAVIIMRMRKEIKEIVFSKEIIIGGGLLNSSTIETVGVNGERRKRYL